jgi:hypothetical protein
LAASTYWFAFLRNRPDDLALEDVASAETGGEEAVLETVLASEAESAVDEAVLELAEDAAAAAADERATPDAPGTSTETPGPQGTEGGPGN